MTLTLPKLLIAAVVIWLAWRWFSRFSARNNQSGHSPGGPTNRPGQPGNPPAQDRAPKERAVEDMVKCPKCGAYVPAKGGHDCTA